MCLGLTDIESIVPYSFTQIHVDCEVSTLSPFSAQLEAGRGGSVEVWINVINLFTFP